LDEVYLKHWLNSPDVFSLMVGLMAGSAIRRLTLTTIASQPIFLPPLSEQRRIAARLDHLLAGTVRARIDLDRVPILIAKYKEALLAAAFSGELTRQWRKGRADSQPVEPRTRTGLRKKFATDVATFIPPYSLPDGWRWLRLPELGELDRGKSRHRPRNDPILFGGPYPFVQTGEVRAAERFLRSFSLTYNDLGLAQSRLWPVGTVCITIAANIAETAILAIDACFPDSVVGFLPDKDRASPSFTEFFLRTARAQLASFAPATAQKNINLDTLSSLRVPVAPLDEQDEVVRRIEAAFMWLDTVALEHARAARLLPKLDQAILAKAFRGEFKPQQDLRDERASELLARIRAERGKRPNQRRGRKPRRDVKSRAPRERAAMTKSRYDHDVRNKPYLADLLRQMTGIVKVEDLFRHADLPLTEFYKQLKWEVDRGHIRDDNERLEAA
jgi:type I restriction enzyme S subunit